MKFMFGLQHSLTCKPSTTLSNPCNKARGEYIVKEVFLRFPSCFLSSCVFLCVSVFTIIESLWYSKWVYNTSPDWPFQQIVMDFFHVRNHGYLASADWLSGWLISYHLSHGQTKSSRLISICRDIFQTYGAPEELSNGSALPFTPLSFKHFLEV